jgi:hypothetical protein
MLIINVTIKKLLVNCLWEHSRETTHRVSAGVGEENKNKGVNIVEVMDKKGFLVENSQEVKPGKEQVRVLWSLGPGSAY